jgi:hypothetical protein
MTNSRLMRTVPAALIAAALLVPASTAFAAPATSSFQASQSQAAPAAGAQGIIMRDGGICDPIRWGC